MPMGQVMGTHLMPRRFSTSVMRSKGSCPGRSSLFMKVTTGVLRSRHTWKSLRVCVSTPLATSMSITAQSAAVSVR
jgi:hypothetical protein